MPDIRKMLEKQLENLQDASINSEATAECTYAMLAIADVLYPDGIPEASVASRLVANITADSKSIVSEVVDVLGRKSSLIAGPGTLDIKISE